MRSPTPFSKIAFPLFSNFARFDFYLISGFCVITWFLRLQSNFVEYRDWKIFASIFSVDIVMIRRSSENVLF